MLNQLAFKNKPLWNLLQQLQYALRNLISLCQKPVKPGCRRVILCVSHHFRSHICITDTGFRYCLFLLNYDILKIVYYK